jgi:RHS repeat-associated protein
LHSGGETPLGHRAQEKALPRNLFCYFFREKSKNDLPLGAKWFFENNFWLLVFAEKNHETGLHQFEARQGDSRLGRWLAPDPARQFWSPYLGMGNNPVSGVDPDGREVFDNITGSGFPLIEKAFNMFATSFYGKWFIGFFAKGGQVIAGVEYNENGIFHDLGIDVEFGTKDLTDKNHSYLFKEGGPRGTTDWVDANNRKRAIITINNFWDKGIYATENHFVFSRINTLFHESYIHVFDDTQRLRFQNDLWPTMRDNPVSSGISRSQHIHAINPLSEYFKRAYPELQRFNSILNLGLNENQIINNYMYTYELQ